MRACPAIRERFSSALGAVVIGLLAGSARAQPVQLGFMMQPTQVELTAPNVEVISGAIAARLEQAWALAAGRNWDEAVDIYRELIADKSDRVVVIDGNRYASLRTYCHLQIARLPAEGLAAYRHRADPPAEQMYREGVANRDERQLRQVVDDWFCSSWGDDALLVLGELALERGDYETARRTWEQISPLLCAPNGMPMWLALRDIDLNAKWPEVERRWQTREKPADCLAYPDTQLDLADVRARLVLASIRAGALDRAAFELEIFRRLHPSASGQLAGQKENYAVALERLLGAAREWSPVTASTDWPTFAGSQTRGTTTAPLGAVLVPAWKEPIQLSPPKYIRSVHLVQGGVGSDGLAKEQPDAAVCESQRPLSSHPIVVGGVIVFADGVGIHAADLTTGKPAITATGLLYDDESAEGKAALVPFGLAGGIGHGVPRLTLNALDGIVYARIGALATSHAQANQSAGGDRIVGLDLRREGLLTFQSPREEADWAFDGTPVSDGRHVFVAMRHSDITPRAYVACFDAATGIQQWRTPIGAADTIAGGAADEITHNLLTLVENRIYLNTNLGLVAALDADSGHICWVSRYDRSAVKTFTAGSAVPLHFDRDPSPCLYHDGLLVVAPSDTPTIFELDANTGKTVWQQDQLPNALNLLGVVGKHLIVAGEGIASLDISSGHVGWTWPDSDRAGIRGMGRGVIAGNEVFWPTRSEIYVIDPKTGAQTRAPINLVPLTGGANLAVSRGRLIVAGYDKLTVLGPPGAVTPKSAEAAKVPGAARTGRLSGQTEVK